MTEGERETDREREPTFFCYDFLMTSTYQFITVKTLASNSKNTRKENDMFFFILFVEVDTKQPSACTFSFLARDKCYVILML